MFPRTLNIVERSAIYKLLPEDKPGYNSYRNRIDQMVLVGNGRFGGSNFVLGFEGDKPDVENPSAPVLAMGEILLNDSVNHIVIHEEKDNKIEIELDGLDNINADDQSDIELKGWSYSDWQPGERAPGDGSSVREVSLPGNSFMLIFTCTHKRIWVHEFDSGINYLIPVTNYFNELMMIKRDKSGRNPTRLFEELNDFSDEDMTAAFINYGRYLSKFKIDVNDAAERKIKKRKFLNLFS